MKTSYQLAMERLAKQSPAVTLSADQKRKIAELDSKFKAKQAERELAAQSEIDQAEATGNIEAADKARQQLADERRKLKEDFETKKDAVRRRA